MKKVSDELITEYTTRMNDISMSDDDTERKHVQADALLIALLMDVGFTELAWIYDEMEKWYS